MSPASQAASPCGGRSPSHRVTPRKPCATTQSSHRNGVPQRESCWRTGPQISLVVTGFGLTCHLARVNRRRAICRSAVGRFRVELRASASGLVPSAPAISLQARWCGRRGPVGQPRFGLLNQAGGRRVRWTDHRQARHRERRQTQREIVNETERVLAAARLRGGHSVTVAPVPLSSDVGAFGTRATRSAQRMLESLEIPARSFDVARHRDDRELRGEHARSGL